MQKSAQAKKLTFQEQFSKYVSRADLSLAARSGSSCRSQGIQLRQIIRNLINKFPHMGQLHT